MVKNSTRKCVQEMVKVSLVVRKIFDSLAPTTGTFTEHWGYFQYVVTYSWTSRQMTLTLELLTRFLSIWRVNASLFNTLIFISREDKTTLVTVHFTK